jgi:hypothetical protein
MAFAPYVETKTGGWLMQKEHEMIYQFSTMQVDPRMSFAESTPPEEVDPSDWLKMENQANQGACQGHSVSDCIEILHVMMGGEYKQLSRACAYYESQRIDNIRGDRGSTIQAGVRLAKEKGIPLESAWPYPSGYNPRRPPGWDSGPMFKIDGHTDIKSYEGGQNHLAFHGPIHIGISWGNEIDQQVSRTGKIESFTGRGGGGHSVCYVGYKRTDWDGNALPGSDPWWLLKNSWSTRWGRNGYALVSPSAIRSMLGHRWTVFAGLHGAPSPTPANPFT